MTLIKIIYVKRSDLKPTCLVSFLFTFVFNSRDFLKVLKSRLWTTLLAKVQYLRIFCHVFGGLLFALFCYFDLLSAIFERYVQVTLF